VVTSLKQPCGEGPPGDESHATRLIPATDNRDDRSPPGDTPDRSSPSRPLPPKARAIAANRSPHGIEEATHPVVVEPDSGVRQVRE